MKNFSSVILSEERSDESKDPYTGRTVWSEENESFAMLGVLRSAQDDSGKSCLQSRNLQLETRN